MTAIQIDSKNTHKGGTQWLNIDGLTVLVQEEKHPISSWFRVYVRAMRRGDLHDYYLGDVSSIAHETYGAEKFYSKPQYHHAYGIHNCVDAGVKRLVETFLQSDDHRGSGR